jgi:hypothetical protein
MLLSRNYQKVFGNNFPYEVAAIFERILECATKHTSAGNASEGRGLRECLSEAAIPKQRQNGGEKQIPPKTDSSGGFGIYRRRAETALVFFSRRANNVRGSEHATWFDR